MSVKELFSYSEQQLNQVPSFITDITGRTKKIQQLWDKQECNITYQSFIVLKILSTGYNDGHLKYFVNFQIKVNGSEYIENYAYKFCWWCKKYQCEKRDQLH